MIATVSLRLLVLKTRQLERLLVFYRALGIELAEEQHGEGPVHHAGSVGGTMLELYPLPEGDGHADRTTRLGFAVQDLAETLRSLVQIGAAVATEPRQTTWGLRAVVRDPDGRAVELYQA